MKRYAIVAAAVLLAPLAASIGPSIGSLGGANPAKAHHSFAMFDRNREVTIKGTVRQFQWANPHAYIQLTSTTGRGAEIEWSLEMGSPMYLYARGWRPRTLRPGQEVTVRLNPLHSGANGGVVLNVTDANGAEIGTNQ